MGTYNFTFILSVSEWKFFMSPILTLQVNGCSDIVALNLWSICKMSKWTQDRPMILEPPVYIVKALMKKWQVREPDCQKVLR